MSTRTSKTTKVKAPGKKRRLKKVIKERRDSGESVSNSGRGDTWSNDPPPPIPGPSGLA